MTLAFEEVMVPAGRRRMLQALTLTVEPGQCVACVGGPVARASVADLALGMRMPAAGRVTFEGVEWSARPGGRRAEARARIGSALDRASWLSDLGIEENLVLAERMLRGRTTTDVLEEAAGIAARLGLAGIPAGRPHELGVDVLRALTFVRALLGGRRVLVLEDPGRLLPDSTRGALAAEVGRRRREGTTVLWLGGSAVPRALEPVASVALRLVKTEAEEVA